MPSLAPPANPRLVAFAQLAHTHGVVRARQRVEHGPGVVDRGVVDHDDLDERVGLVAQGRHAGRQVVGAVPVDHDRRHASRARGRDGHEPAARAGPRRVVLVGTEDGDRARGLGTAEGEGGALGHRGRGDHVDQADAARGGRDLDLELVGEDGVLFADRGVGHQRGDPVPARQHVGGEADVDHGGLARRQRSDAEALPGGVDLVQVALAAADDGADRAGGDVLAGRDADPQPQLGRRRHGADLGAVHVEQQDVVDPDPAGAVGAVVGAFVADPGRAHQLGVLGDALAGGAVEDDLAPVQHDGALAQLLAPRRGRATR